MPVNISIELAEHALHAPASHPHVVLDLATRLMSRWASSIACFSMAGLSPRIRLAMGIQLRGLMSYCWLRSWFTRGEITPAGAGR